MHIKIQTYLYVGPSWLKYNSFITVIQMFHTWSETV